MFPQKTTLRDAKETFEQAKEDLEDAAHQAGQKVRQIYNAATSETREATAIAAKQIRSHPLAASAIAAGIGFVLGALFRRR